VKFTVVRSRLEQFLLAFLPFPLIIIILLLLHTPVSPFPEYSVALTRQYITVPCL
jgi:hypothetical protein